MLISWCRRRTRRLAANRRTRISKRPHTEKTPIPDSINYRRHKGACCHYRENWNSTERQDGTGDEVLYQIVCLMDTPPVTKDEQRLCMQSPNGCWRLKHAASRKNGRNGHAAREDSDEEPAQPEKSSRR